MVSIQPQVLGCAEENTDDGWVKSKPCVPIPGAELGWASELKARAQWEGGSVLCESPGSREFRGDNSAESPAFKTPSECTESRECRCSHPWWESWGRCAGLPESWLRNPEPWQESLAGGRRAPVLPEPASGLCPIRALPAWAGLSTGLGGGEALWYLRGWPPQDWVFIRGMES